MNHNEGKMRWIILVLAGISFGSGLDKALAADSAWATNAASGAWENGVNWASGNAPGSVGETTNSDMAVFSNVSATVAIAPDSGRNIGGMVFTNPACAAYTIGTNSGNALLLSSGGAIALLAGVTNSQTVGAPLVLQGDGGSYLLTNASGKTLTVNGGITGVASGTNVTTLNLVATGAGFTSISGGIGDGVAGGKMALVKTGSGTFDLASSNTFTGGITLNAGKLRVMNARAWGTGPLVINGGIIGNTNAITIVTTNEMTWNGNFTHDFPISANMSYGPGSVTLTTNITLTIGPGYGGLIIVPGNIGESGGSRSLTITAGSNPGLLNPRGSNTFSGGIILNTAGVCIGSAQCLGTGMFTINSGTISQNNGGVALQGASGITINGNFLFSCTAGAINLGTIPVTVNGMRGFNVDNGGATIGGIISGVGGGLAISGTAYNGSTTLTGANTFDGGITLSPGSSVLTLNINNTSALGAGPLTMNRGSGGVIKIDNTSSATLTNLGNNIQYWNTSFTYGGATRSLNLGTGPVTLGTNIVTVTVSGSTLTVGGAVGDGGKGYPLTKAGAGTLALAGNCTYTGLTTVAAGKLSLAVGGALAGNVRVMTNATLEVLSSTAISDSATLQIDSNGSVYGVVNLATGVVEVVKELNLGGTLYTQSGTYGSTNSAAANKFPGYFTGTGMIQVAMPHGATLLMVR